MTISQAASVNLWREAVLDRLAVLCMDAPQDEPPASILRRIVAAEVEIALDPSVSDAVPHRTLLQHLDALEPCVSEEGPEQHELDAARDSLAALREALASPEPEPVALESVHLTRDTRGMCVVRVNGRLAIRDNGDIIDHMATLEWFAAPPAAPAPEPVAEVYRARYGRRARYIGVNDVRKLDGVALPPLGTKLYAAPPAASEPVAARRPDCVGSERPGWKRGMRCATCDGSATVAAPPAAPAPAAPVVREPFSRAQLHRLYVNSPELHKDTASEAAFTRIVQLTEAAHGITGGGNG